MIDTFFHQYHPREDRNFTEEEMGAVEAHLFPLSVYCAVWTLGASIDGKSRPKFEEELRRVSAEINDKYQLPSDSLYDVMYQFPGLATEGFAFDHAGEWLPWMDTIPAFDPQRGASYDTIVVPTMDSVRLTKIFQ